MRRPAIARGLPLALAAGLSCLCLACSFLDPAGPGSLSASEREQELEKARAWTRPSADRGASAAAESLGSGAAAVTTATGEAPSVPSYPAGPLDLTTALELASRRNRAIAASAAGLEAAAGEVAAARSALLPTNSVRGAYNWYSQEQTNSIDIDPALFPPGTALPVVTVRQQDFATVSAAVRLALDLSGELRHGLGAAQAAYRAEAARAWATRLDEEKTVVAAYLGLLEAMRLREVELETQRLYERQFTDASSRFDLGRLTRNEVLVVEVALATTRQLLLRLDTSVAAQRRALNRATGLEIHAATEVEDIDRPPHLPSVESALAEARAANPLLTAMLEENRAAEERLVAARRSRFPRLAAGAGYDATTADILEPNNYASAGVVVDFDVGSFRREAEIARLDAIRDRTRILLDSSVRDVEALVRDSHDRVRERMAAVDLARVAVRQAEENWKIRRAQFDEGRATSEDVLDASELLTLQRAILASSLYQAHARRAELQQVMGRPLAELAAPGAPAEPAAPAAPAAIGPRKGDSP
ncbi:MAG: TolC family protein [Candidatus Binatia bacterium]